MLLVEGGEASVEAGHLLPLSAAVHVQSSPQPLAQELALVAVDVVPHAPGGDG